MLRRRRGRRKIKSGKGILGWGQWTRSWTRRIWSGGPRVGDGRSGTTCVWPLKGNRIGRRVGDLWWSRDPASTLARLGKVSLGLGSKNPERPSGGLGARGAWHARDLAPALGAQAAASGCSALRRSRLSSAPGSLPRGGSPWSGQGWGGGTDAAQGQARADPGSCCGAAPAPPRAEQQRGAGRGRRAWEAGPLTPLEARGRIGFGACGRLGQKWPPVPWGPVEGPGFVED